MTSRPGDRRSFPGGSVRLPRLGAPESDDPELTYVGTAFVRTEADTADTHATSSFSEYYTTESLFEPPEEGSGENLADPYHVLGLEPDAEWREIVSAHRRLAKAFHPDRFVGQPQEVVDRMDDNIKRINVAYAELDRRFHDTGDD